MMSPLGGRNLTNLGKRKEISGTEQQECRIYGPQGHFEEAGEIEETEKFWEKIWEWINKNFWGKMY